VFCEKTSFCTNGRHHRRAALCYNARVIRAYVPWYLVRNYLAFAFVACLGALQIARARRDGTSYLPGLIVLLGAFLGFYALAPELLTPGPAGGEMTFLFGGAALFAVILTPLTTRRGSRGRGSEIGNLWSEVGVSRPASLKFSIGYLIFPFLSLLVILFDVSLFHALNGLALRTQLIDVPAQFLMNDYIVPTALVLALLALWFAGRDDAERTDFRRAALRALVALALASIVLKLINEVYFRPRPFTFDDSVRLLFYHPSDSSMPSNAATVCWHDAIARHRRRPLSRRYCRRRVAGRRLGLAGQSHQVAGSSSGCSGRPGAANGAGMNPAVLRRPAAILIICLLAFGLRVYRLGSQSLWYDEGLSVYLAGLPPLDTIQVSALTDHPPLHALMLGAWMQVAGRSEFAVRFVSLWWGVLATALTWRLGRELLTDVIGAIGATLTAVSAFAVWYAQETRGYSLLLALTLVATWAFVRLCHSEPRSGLKFGIWYLIFGIAALYTHYYAAFTLLGINLSFLAVLACRTFSKRPISNTQYLVSLSPISFCLSQLLILAAFAPWLPAAIRQAATNVTYFPGRVGWQTVVGDTLRALATGDVASTEIATWGVGAMGLLAFVGAFAEQPGTTRLNRVIVALLVAVPVAAMAAIAWQKPKFAPRYLIEALPAFYLLVGAGFAALWRSVVGHHRILSYGRRTLVIAGASVLLVTSAFSLRATYFDPARQRPDVRGVATYIKANEKPGDVIVLLSGHQSPVFSYYYGGANLQYPMPSTLMPPAQSPLDYSAARQLNDIAYRHDRLWLVLWQRELADPTDVVMNELLTKTRRLGVGQDFNGMRLMLFDLRDHLPLGDGPQHALGARFSEPIALAGYDLNAASRAPGESLDLALYWQASGRIARNYQVFTHLLAPDGKMVGGSDHIAGADNYPTSLWADGALIRNNFTLRIPPDASPGEYAIEVGLYDAKGRLKLADGADRLLLAEIVVK
jgi:hypothetical protein